MPRRFGYSRWDGTQVGPDFDADDVLAEITDDLLYHGDLNAAVRRLLQSGFGDRNGERVAGVRELLERLRRRRQEELARHDLGGVYEDIAAQLGEVVDAERRGIESLVEDARRSGDERRRSAAEELAADRGLQLDLMPTDLGGRLQALQEYDFTSPEAARRFAELVDRLRQQLLQSQFNRMAGALSDVSPDQLQRTKDMLDELNRLLETREAGEDTGEAFERFMERFGDMFPTRPGSLDELLEQMARQMAAMQSVLNSLSPEQRAELQGLAEQLLADMDLSWQVDRLSANLRAAFPDAGWGNSWAPTGEGPLDLPGAAALMDRLGDLDQLEHLLRWSTGPGALADVDLDRAGELLGDDAARSLDRLAELSRRLEEAGLVEQRAGRLELTPKGLRRIGQNALSDLFTKLARDRLGRHPADRTGPGQERAHETKPYEFGDLFHLSIERTVRNALHRCGGGTPVRLAPEDFEVERTEALTRTSTVLMLDLSLSMPMRDNFLAAKKVAMALHALISSRFPQDYLGLVGFSEVARPLRAEQLPEVSWDFEFGTNMQHGLALSRRLLATRPGTRQIIMITDGEPTAHVGDDGEVFFNYPPVPETVDATLTEVLRCTRAGIRINTFMLDATSYLKSFVEKLTTLNRGRAFFTTPETLGDYVLVDFIEQKRTVRTAEGDRPAS